MQSTRASAILISIEPQRSHRIDSCGASRGIAVKRPMLEHLETEHTERPRRSFRALKHGPTMHRFHKRVNPTKMGQPADNLFSSHVHDDSKKPWHRIP